MSKKKIVLVGGGSVNWSPLLINDLTLTPGLEEAEYTILDLNPEAGRKMVQLGQKLSKERSLSCGFNYTDNQKEAFTGVDFVIITITTGDLDAMEYDLKIPEDYRIYQTVGDTVGPGGWARGLRNIPVFADMAKNIEKYSPEAVILNYTNPMSVLTNVFYKVGSLKTVGLCHGLFEVYDVLMKIFKLESEEEVKVNFGGTNHFFWVTDLKIQGEDGYELLKHKMNGRPFAELVEDAYIDNAGFHSNKWVCSELLDHYGFLPYVADRHICEFLPSYLTRDTGKIEKYKLERTSIEQRRENKRINREYTEAYIRGTEKLPDKRSRESAAEIICSFISGKEFIDVANLPNRGQISNLPAGSIVETLSIINSTGFVPLTVGQLPEQILNLQLPHIRNQDMIVEAGLEGDFDKAISALYNDPLCSHLTLPETKEMGMRLLKAHEQYLPQFFKK
jgi:alpha-galactosidase